MLSDIILHNMGRLFEPHMQMHMCTHTLSLSFSHTQYITTWTSSEFQVWTESSCMPQFCQLWHIRPWGWWFSRRPSTWFVYWTQEGCVHMHHEFKRLFNTWRAALVALTVWRHRIC